MTALAIILTVYALNGLALALRLRVTSGIGLRDCARWVLVWPWLLWREARS